MGAPGPAVDPYIPALLAGIQKDPEDLHNHPYTDTSPPYTDTNLLYSDTDLPYSHTNPYYPDTNPLD
jgi:hypothetical protein